jgi:glycosyltransferase involved in cell wall biosynthesis
MVRCAILTSSFPRHADDGAGCFLVPLCHALKAQGLSVEVIAPRAPGDSDAEVEGIRVWRAPYAPRPLETLFYGAGALSNMAQMPLAAAWQAPAAVVSLAWQVRRLGPDVVFAHWMVPAGLAAWMLHRTGGPPYVLYCHGSDVTLLERVPRGPVLAALIARHARGVCAPSPSLLERVRTLTGVPNKRLHLLPLPVAQSNPAAEPLPGAPFDVGYLGRLLESKGVHVLLEAVRHTGRSLLVAGDGPARDHVMRGVRDGNRVVFLGALSPRQRARFFSSVRLLAVPSLGPEGSPSVVAEAAAWGVPAVGSHVPGLSDLLPAQALVPPGDAKALGALLNEACTSAPWRDQAVGHAAALVAKRAASVVGPALENLVLGSLC